MALKHAPPDRGQVEFITKMCIMYFSVEGVSRPDPFLIDQARAVLMQLSAQNIASISQNRYSFVLLAFFTMMLKYQEKILLLWFYTGSFVRIVLRHIFH